MITNFRKRKECPVTGIIAAFVDDQGHQCLVVWQGAAWGFMNAERILTTEEQAYCAEMNYEAEQTGETS